jgi:hypothetical protein
MAGSHVVTALVSKRAGMAGLIEHRGKEKGRLAAELAQLDATVTDTARTSQSPDTLTPPGSLPASGCPASIRTNARYYWLWFTWRTAYLAASRS